MWSKMRSWSSSGFGHDSNVRRSLAKKSLFHRRASASRWSFSTTSFVAIFVVVDDDVDDDVAASSS